MVIVEVGEDHKVGWVGLDLLQRLLAVVGKHYLVAGSLQMGLDELGAKYRVIHDEDGGLFTLCVEF